MKFLLFVMVAISSLAAFAQVCPGRCINTSGNSFYDGACSGAGIRGGATACYQYSNLGCTWTQQQPIQIPGRCVNHSGNQFYDGACSGAGIRGGQRACNEYSNLGCVWYPSQFTCQ